MNARFIEIPRAQWPQDIPTTTGSDRVSAWQSRDFLVQLFTEGDFVMRLTVNRKRLLPNGRFDDAITWDELMSIKRDCGFPDKWAVEVFPDERHVVNVANMRHLWLLPNRPAFAWFDRKKGGA